MKTPFLFRWITGCAVAACLQILPATAATKTNVPASATKAKSSAAATKSNTPAAVPVSVELQPVAIPQSVFDLPKLPKEGRDPFYPDSLRVFGTSSAARTNTPAKVVTFVLKGLAGPAANRFATIGITGPAGTSQSVDLAVGEEREMVTPTGRVKVRCVEITDDLVVIEAAGTRRELRLRGAR